MATVIDIHTHAFGQPWLDMLIEHGAPNYGTKQMHDGKEYLLEKGVPGSQLEARGYGEVNPIANNRTEDGRAENRRVELKRLD